MQLLKSHLLKPQSQTDPQYPSLKQMPYQHLSNHMEHGKKTNVIVHQIDQPVILDHIEKKRISQPYKAIKKQGKGLNH
jgi:hypothetical protein